MPLLETILSNVTGDFIKDIVTLFKVPPEQVEQHAFELKEAQLAAAGKLQDAITAEVQAASANIRAEQTNDGYTSHARPTFLYIVESILAFNFIGLPLLKHWGFGPIDLPTPLLWLFGSCMLGYTGARSWEKVLGLPGDSSIKLPFGIEAKNSN